MPRIRDDFLDCAIYLYSNKSAADNGEKAGGSGVLVGMSSAGDDWLAGGNCPESTWFNGFAVSSRSVVEKSPVIRLNSHDGKSETLEIQPDAWIISETDDLAVGPLIIPCRPNISAFDHSHL